jgi:hypothetical protein
MFLGRSNQTDALLHSSWTGRAHLNKCLVQPRWGTCMGNQVRTHCRWPLMLASTRRKKAKKPLRGYFCPLTTGGLISVGLYLGHRHGPATPSVFSLPLSSASWRAIRCPTPLATAYEPGGVPYPRAVALAGTCPRTVRPAPSRGPPPLTMRGECWPAPSPAPVVPGTVPVPPRVRRALAPHGLPPATVQPAALCVPQGAPGRGRSAGTTRRSRPALPTTAPGALPSQRLPRTGCVSCPRRVRSGERIHRRKPGLHESQMMAGKVSAPRVFVLCFPACLSNAQHHVRF